MALSARMPYEDRESTTTKWVVIFVLLSLLAHVFIIAAIMLITIFMPVPKMKPFAPANPTVTVTLEPPPVQIAPKKPIFIPTTPEANAPHKQQQVESANDHDLTSRNQTPRTPDSLMPDVTGREHAADLNNSPNVQSRETQPVTPTPPTPKQQAKPQKPTPPQPKPPQPTPPQPPQPAPQPAPKPTPPQKTPPKLDPNGLPVLPPINARTLAQVDPSLVSPPPAASVPMQATSVHGALGQQGDNSPAAMATALGKYKQKVYRAVGSRWYPKVDPAFQVIGVGTVHIQFTIHSDGTVDTKVLDGGDSRMQMLRSISINSILEAAPYDPFPPEMVKELIQAQGGDGTSYTDDFTFSVY